MTKKDRRFCFMMGCITPFIIILSMYMTWLFGYWRQTFYIQDLQLYVQITRLPFCDAKMSFSKNNNFGTDYVKYNNSSDIVWMDVYYVPPLTICVSGASSIKQNNFRIIEYERLEKYHKLKVDSEYYVPEYYYEYTDSTFLKENGYFFDIYDYFSGFSVYDSKGKTIFKGGAEL